MTKYILILPVLLGVLAMTTRAQTPRAQTPRAQTPDDKNALLKMEQEWNNALKTKDVVWFERNLASDVTDTSSGNGALHTKAEDIAALKEDKTTYDSLELSNLNARLEGNA